MLPRIVRHHQGEPFCITEYKPAEQWLLTTWLGFVSSSDAEEGALGALDALGETKIPYLLNDNSQIQGPWFDSADWLQRVWAPQAARLGLRYVAHVAQPHTEADFSFLPVSAWFGNQFELQVFSTLSEAQEWLHECQRQAAQAATPAPTPLASSR